MPLRLGLTTTNEIVCKTSDGEIVIRRAYGDTDGRDVFIAAPRAIEITRRERAEAGRRRNGLD